LALGIALALFTVACHSESSAGGKEIAVAAAANLTEVAQILGQEFQAETGIHATFSFASTAQLTSQIENGAPFDVFLAADSTHVDELDQRALLDTGSGTVYADGILALWVPSKTSAIRRVEDLALPEVRVISLAKPELAPYGQAAVETLRQAGVWDAVESKIVYAENVNAAKQYGTSGNADAVFVAYSLVLKETGTVIQIPESAHRPIAQKLGIVKASAHQAEARRFVDFTLRGKGRAMLESHGYRIPAPPK
jgi:molybdate transport system substrate-binding protein